MQNQCESRATFSGMLVLAGTVMLLVGCGPVELPPGTVLQRPGLPEKAAPVYTWTATTPPMSTYWDKQVAVIQAKGHFPEPWKGDHTARWEVKAHSDKNVVIPYLGVLRRFKDSMGKEMSEVVPSFTEKTMNDGLYVVMENHVTVAKDNPEKIVKLEPRALVIELRGGLVKPFTYPVLMTPDKATEMTPVPEGIGPDRRPMGTPLNVPKESDKKK